MGEFAPRITSKKSPTEWDNLGKTQQVDYIGNLPVESEMDVEDYIGNLPDGSGEDTEDYIGDLPNSPEDTEDYIGNLSDDPEEDVKDYLGTVAEVAPESPDVKSSDDAQSYEMGM